MSDLPVPQGGVPEELRAMLRKFMGDAADEAIEALEDSGFDVGVFMRSAGLGDNPGALAMVFGQLQRMMDAQGDSPVNWTLAHDLARDTAARSGGDRSLAASERKAVDEAVSVAELWLDQVTDLPRSPGATTALTRAEWVEATLPRWRAMTEPVAASIGTAIADAVAERASDLPGLGGADGPAGMIRTLGGTLFGAQLGQAVGTLATEVVGLTDIGVPLVAAPGAGLLPVNVEAFAAGLETPIEEVRLYLAAREAAHARLFSHVTWLPAHLVGAILAYARGIEIDGEAIEDAVSRIDPSDPEAMQATFDGSVFEIEVSEDQKRALARLETALALVEGWVEEVVDAAVEGKLPNAPALSETIRRRRAAGGPAEHTFASLVGLRLRPRRARDAAELWHSVAAELGQSGREALWAHPDLLPSPEDLDDPVGFLARRAAAAEADADIDSALAAILGDSDGPEPTSE